MRFFLSSSLHLGGGGMKRSRGPKSDPTRRHGGVEKGKMRSLDGLWIAGGRDGGSPALHIVHATSFVRTGLAHQISLTLKGCLPSAIKWYNFTITLTYSPNVTILHMRDPGGYFFRHIQWEFARQQFVFVYFPVQPSSQYCERSEAITTGIQSRSGVHLLFMWWSLPPPTTTLPGQPGGATPNEIISNTGPGPGGRGASETPGGAGAGSVEAGNFLLKFEDFQFDASYHDKYITLESIMGPRSIENPKEYLPPSVTMGTGTPTSANTSTSTTPRLRNAQVRNGAPAAVGVTGLSGPSSSATSSTTMSTSSSPAINGITGSTTAFSSSPTMMNWESEQV
ncbi:hypothetical protein HHX47_DHR2000567 [Lentinula edodes]|nr:hypothetical protein HHX47_DHR2000567 [Lentinula edodes]